MIFLNYKDYLICFYQYPIAGVRTCNYYYAPLVRTPQVFGRLSFDNFLKVVKAGGLKFPIDFSFFELKVFHFF